MSILGVVVSTLGTAADSDPRLFIYGGTAISLTGFIIDLASFSKLKFEKNYKNYDKKTKTYTFE